MFHGIFLFVRELIRSWSCSLVCSWRTNTCLRESIVLSFDRALGIVRVPLLTSTNIPTLGNYYFYFFFFILIIIYSTFLFHSPVEIICFHNFSIIYGLRIAMHIGIFQQFHFSADFVTFLSVNIIVLFVY